MQSFMLDTVETPDATDDNPGWVIAQAAYVPDAFEATAAGYAAFLAEWYDQTHPLGWPHASGTASLRVRVMVADPDQGWISTTKAIITV